MGEADQLKTQKTMSGEMPKNAKNLSNFKRCGFTSKLKSD